MQFSFSFQKEIVTRCFSSQTEHLKRNSFIFVYFGVKAGHSKFALAMNPITFAYRMVVMSKQIPVIRRECQLISYEKECDSSFLNAHAMSY